jgi:uncharacterized protein (DUF305 family)
MKAITTLSTLLLATALTASPATACGCCGGGNQQAQAQSSEKPKSSCMGGMQGMGNMGGTSNMAEMDHSKMDMSGTKPQSTGNPDVDFAKNMIPHHQGALDMAKALLKDGKDPELRKLAEDVIKAQEKEINFLNEWLKKNSK